MPREFTEELVLKNSSKNVSVGVCFCHFLSCMEPDKYLSVEEQEYYNTLVYDNRKRSYLLGRYSAKCAINILTKENSLKNIVVQNGFFNQPVVLNNQNIQVSIAHCDNYGAAAAFPEAYPIGVDLERVDQSRNDIMESQLTQDEKQLIKIVPLSYDGALTFFWTVKESLSKTIKTGLTTPFQVLEVNKVEPGKDCITSYYKNFTQYKVMSLDLCDYIFSITYPKGFEVEIDTESLKEYFIFIRTK